MKVLVLLFILVNSIFADELIDELKDDMQKFSNVAIETNQNVDYMPYIISTLTQKDLSTLGVKNLKEAITLIPNVDISIGMAGVNTPIFRGSNPFAFGQSKLLIDGIVVNDALFGGYYHYLEMPISIIKRIEIVRGAGAIKDSINAYSGLINVVTFLEEEPFEKAQTNIFTAIGSYSYKMGGFSKSYIKDNFKIHTDFFYQEDDKNLPSGYDRFKYNEMNAHLSKSGEVPLWLKNYSFGFSLANNGLELKLRSFRNKGGVSYGQSYNISEDLSDYLDITTNFIDIKKSIKLNSFTKLIFNLNYLNENRKLQNKVMPSGTKMMMPNGDIWSFSNGGYFLVDYQEDIFKEAIELNFDLNRHNIVAGININQARIISNNSKMTKPDPNPNNIFMPQNLLSTTKRDFFTLYFKDRFDLNEKIAIESNLIYQKFSDLNPEINPRVSIVYRQNPNTIYKAMYTHSFREPSLREQYITGAHYYQGNIALDKEKVNSFELAYIKKYLNDSYLKLNLFYLLNKDEIIPRESDRVFTNQRMSDIYGFEIEYKTNFSSKDDFYINYSLTDGTHENSSDSYKMALSNVARDMIKGYYNYKLTNNLNLSTIFKYVGEKNRAKVDNREKLKAYKSFDTTLRYINEKDNYEITFSIKNLLNEEIKLPSPPMSYEDDFFSEKRNFFISFKKTFK